jgi:hypothetical protein
MTTTVPSPADFARRAPRPAPAALAQRPAAAETTPELPAAEAALQPGRLKGKEHFRKLFHQAIRISGMTPHARLLALDLAQRASHATGRITPALQPSVERLSHATGLTTGQVHVALEILRSRGFLRHHRLAEGPRTGELRWDLAIPAGVLERLRTRPAAPTA